MSFLFATPEEVQAAAVFDAPAGVANGFLNGETTLPAGFTIGAFPTTINVPLMEFSFLPPRTSQRWVRRWEQLPFPSAARR